MTEKSYQEAAADVAGKIAAAEATIANAKAKRADLALALAMGDAEAVTRTAELRAEERAAAEGLEDLRPALEKARGLAAAERAAQRLEAERAAWRAMLTLGDAAERAAVDVQRALLELAAAMAAADGLAQRAWQAAVVLLGPAAGAFAPPSCADAVLGGLVRMGALPRHALPAVYVGELGYVLPATAQAHALAEALRARAPADLGASAKSEPAPC
jgi:hypothetical protein